MLQGRYLGIANGLEPGDIEILIRRFYQHPDYPLFKSRKGVNPSELKLRRIIRFADKAAKQEAARGRESQCNSGPSQN